MDVASSTAQRKRLLSNAHRQASVIDLSKASRQESTVYVLAYAFVSSSDWFTGMSACVVIGQSNYFGLIRNKVRVIENLSLSNCLS